jgi:ABC-2 type transport system permease protein
MKAMLARISAISGKEFIHIRRDPRILVSVLVMPVLQLLLFAYAISFDVRDVPTILLDGDRTPQSREYLGAYEHSDFFHVVDRVDSHDEIDNAFDTSSARVAIMVAPGFADAIARGELGRVSVLIDGSEPNSAQLGQAYAVALNNRLDREVFVEWAETRAFDAGAFGGVAPVVRTWYNPDRRSADFLVPGLMVVIIMIVTIQQTAVTLVRERDHGTFEQLAISPVRRGELMVGKVAPWVMLAFANMIGTSLVAITVFGVPLRGDVLTLMLGTLLFVLASLSIGLVISARASSVEVANITGLMISFLPGFMLSGFAFPLVGIPPFLQFVSYLFPGRYMVTIARSVFLKGAGIDVLWPQVAALGAYALVGLTLASLLYARRSD